MENENIILETQDLIKQFDQYDTLITAVNRVNLKVYEGEFVAVIGSSGSGKSTLLNLLAGLDRPNSGKIIIKGTEITALNNDQLADFRGNYMGVVFQSHNLIPQLTAMENILVPTLMCGKPEISYEENFKRLVAGLDIGDRLHHLPGELSGGQRQRVAIARALINLPLILFADEPTGNLDRAGAEDVLELLLKIREEMKQTLIMVTHDINIAKRADRILRMDSGRLSELKSTEEL